MTRRPAQRLHDVFLAVEAGIERRADLDRAWTEATELAAEIDTLAAEVSALRSRLAMKIRDRDALKLEDLARRLSVSTSRASQLVRGVRR